MALQLACTPSFPLTAYTALHNVVDAASFRQGINQLYWPTSLCTAADYQKLQERVKQLLPLVNETASYDWFLAGLSAPPVGRSTIIPDPAAPLPMPLLNNTRPRPSSPRPNLRPPQLQRPAPSGSPASKVATRRP